MIFVAVTYFILILQVALKFQNASKELLETHYEDLKSKPFFPALIQYISSGPVVPMVCSEIFSRRIGT